MLSRSLLFVPANKERMISKINQLYADVILIDLEDAVEADDKDGGREMIRKYIYQLNKPIFLRVNSLDSGIFEKDMTLIHDICDADSLKGIMLPKSSSAKDIATLLSYMEKAEEFHDRSDKLGIIPLIENALGVHQIDEIITASKRVFQIAFGGEDFTYDIGAQATPAETELLYSRSKIILSSRVYGIEKPIDTVYTDFRDLRGFEKSCTFVRTLGFGGKLLIHPNQTDIANATFSPSADEIEFAEKVVSLAEKNKGAFNLEGKMVDRPIIEKARRIIADASFIETGKED